MLAWMDLEMTGLDHTADVIVEIATLVTDDELNVVAEGPDIAIHHDEDVLMRMDPFVVDMHTRSGLLDQIRASTATLQEAGQLTLAFIKEHVRDARTVPLCGNSIGTDRRFLAAGSARALTCELRTSRCESNGHARNGRRCRVVVIPARERPLLIPS